MNEFNKKSYFNKVFGCWTGKVVAGTFGMPFEGKNPDWIETHYPHGFTGWLGGFNSEISVAHRQTVNDDEQFELISLLLCEEQGIDNFTTENIMKLWLRKLKSNDIFTAERVAYENFNNGISIDKINQPEYNVYYDFIGGQMKGEIYGLWSPGNPLKAAELARIDAAVAHSGVGMAGEEWIARMVSRAMKTKCEPPKTKILVDHMLKSFQELPNELGNQSTNEYSEIGYRTLKLCDENRDPRAWKDTFNELKEYIEQIWLPKFIIESNKMMINSKISINTIEERKKYWPIHTIPNLIIIIIALFYGGGDFGTSITLASLMGWDADCNAGNVGAILGTYLGYKQIPEYFQTINKGEIKTFVDGWKDSSIYGLSRRTAKIGEDWMEMKPDRYFVK